MNKVKTLALLMGAVLGISLLSSCHPPAQGQNGTLNLNQPAPDFQLEDLSNNLISLSDYKGEPIYLNYWATTCPACVEEMPYIQAVYDEWSKRGLRVLTVNAGEDTATVKSFLQKNQYTMPVAVDGSGEVAEKYNIYYIPVSVFIDRQGVLRSKIIGAFPDKAAIDRQINVIMP